MPSSTTSITVWYAARSEALGEARRESGQEDGLQNVFHREVTDEVQGMVEFSNRIEVKINSPRSVSIPPHHVSKFTSKQSSLHALVVKRESIKKGFPDLLCTKCLRGGSVETL